jgi:amino acid adenylation domain-containing protein
MSVIAERAGRSVGIATVHELVQHHAATRPDALAVVHGTQRTTYSELDDLSAGYAARLAGLGVGKGHFLPVALPRSLRLVGVILAALRLGAAYALIDAAWPAERIREVTRQLGTDLLVTDGTLADWPAGGAPGRVPAVDVRPEDPCCVFFTSGSTGRPKGVVSPHRGTVRLIDEKGFASFGTHTVMAQAAAQPWDAFSLELWVPLMAGGTTVLIDEPYLSGPLIRELVSGHALNTVWLTASLFNMLVDEDLSCFGGLDTVMTGGERLSPPHVRSFLAEHRQISLINGFGPVETTVFCSTRRIRPADCAVDGGIPIGVPVPRTRVYVLDGDRVCAPGEIGELCVAGDGLAVGYLGDSELTRLKFPTLRLDGRPERVYRTGDLGLRDADGILHYRGRADSQLKIRGHRIETAEVECVVSGLPGVGRCVVLPRYGAGGECAGMDAVVTPAGQATVDPAALLRELRELLPAYSVPDRLVEVAAIPLTSNGKVDEAALRTLVSGALASSALASSAAAGGHQHAGPVEAAVAEVFASVLGLPATELDPCSTLIALGGTSLDAGRVSARLADALNRPVPASQVFRTPTIRGLAAALDSSPSGPQSPAGTALSGPAALSPMQTEMLAQHLIDPGDLTLQCVLGWRIEGRPDRAALRSAFGYVHARHQYLSSAYVLGKTAIARPGQASFPGMREILVDTEQDARDILDRELARPLLLADGQVWRAVFVAVRQVHLTLLGVSLHHIAFDGTSAAILATDLANAYNAYREGTVPELPPAASAAEVAAAREAQARHADLPRQRDYWRTAMAGVPFLRYPGGGESVRWAPSRAVVATLTPGLASRVRELAARRSVSPFVAHLSAYQQALAAVTGQREFAIGTPMSQRGASCLSQAVSYLINVVCLRLRAGQESTPAEAIAQTAQEVAAAFAAQDVPFSEVIDLAGATANGIRMPLCQNFFGYQDHNPAELHLTGMRTEFFLPRYPDIPNDIFTEIYPQPDGSAQVLISYRPQCVSADFCGKLADRYLAYLRSYTAQ